MLSFWQLMLVTRSNLADVCVISDSNDLCIACPQHFVCVVFSVFLSCDMLFLLLFSNSICSTLQLKSCQACTIKMWAFVAHVFDCGCWFAFADLGLEQEEEVLDEVVGGLLVV